MKSIKFRMTGTCPLMLNNPQTVNPMNEFTKAISELTSKRKKTDEDQKRSLAKCGKDNFKIKSTLTNNILKSRRRKLTQADKFDRHMKRARVNDIDCRKHIFDNQSNITSEREQARKNILSSIY